MLTLASRLPIRVRLARPNEQPFLALQIGCGEALDDIGGRPWGDLGATLERLGRPSALGVMTMKLHALEV